MGERGRDRNSKEHQLDRQNGFGSKGYLRVGTLDQTEVHQLEGLALGKTFTEKAFGKDVKRPQLVRPGRWRDFAGPRSCGRVGRLRG